MNDVTINPRVELVLRGAPDAVTAVTLLAPVRGEPLRTTTVERSEPEVFEVLCQVARGEAAALDVDDATWARLEQIGLLVPRGRVPAKREFFCPLPALDALDARAAAAIDLAALRVNPTLRVAPAPGAPEATWVAAPSAGRRRGAVRGQARVSAFARGAAWATLAQDDAPAPVYLSLADDAERALVARLLPGASPPADLAAPAAARLLAAGVLEVPRVAAARAAAWSTAREAAAASFARDRYALLRRVLPPTWIAALREHYRALIDEGYAAFDTTLGRNRYCMHNEPVSRVVHQALTPLVAQIAGQPLKPSYAYFGAYREGATLVPHRDRDQCPISISLLIDYEPAPAPGAPSPWPLCLNIPRGGDGAVERVDAHLAPGDGAFFDGTHLVHFRPALPPGHRSTSLFLHYVPADFDGGLD